MRIKQLSLQEFTDEWFETMCEIVNAQSAAELQRVVSWPHSLTTVFLFNDTKDDDIVKWIRDTLVESDYVIVYGNLLFSASDIPHVQYKIMRAAAFIKNPNSALQFKLTWS